MSAPCRRGRVWALLMLCGLAGCVGAPTPVAHADRADVTLRLDPDGSLLVDETWLVQTTPTPGAADFERTIPGDRTDGFSDVSAAVDRSPVTEGTGPGHVVVDRSSGLTVRWYLADNAAGPHEFRLAYRALDVLELAGLRGRLVWPLLGGAATADVGSVSADLVIPSVSVLFAPPTLAPGAWRVRRADGHTMATAIGLTAGDWPVTLRAELTADQLKMPVPAWQMTEDRIGQLMPAFVSGGVFLLVIGVGAIAMLAAQYRRGRPSDELPDPDVSHSAIELALAHGGRPSKRESPAAAVVGLVERGRLVVDAAGNVSMAAPGEAETPAHEALILAIPSTEGTRALPVAGFRAALASAAGRITQALRDDLVRGELVSRDRVGVRRGLYGAGVTVVVLGVACAGLIPIMRPRYGWWPAAIPIGVVIDGLLLLAYAPLFSVLTDRGAVRAKLARRRMKGRVPGAGANAAATGIGVALGLPARVARALTRG